MIGIVNSSFWGLLGLAYHREVIGLAVLHIGCVNNSFTGTKSVSGIISRGREISSKVLNMKTVMIYNHGNRIHKLSRSKIFREQKNTTQGLILVDPNDGEIL